MAFKSIFQLDHGAINDTDEVIFDAYSSEFNSIKPGFIGQYQKDNIKIASVFLNDKKAYIYSTCPCTLLSAGDAVQGERITKITEIGYFAAEAEDIPNGRPSAVIKFE